MQTRIQENLISIIIPIYNMEKYLIRCLDSVIGQTYQNIEIILINDGSWDKSEEICLKYKNQYSFIHYEKQVNAGVAAARNRGMELAKGEWICFVDPDDYLEADCLERLNYEITGKCDVVCCGCMAEVNGQSVKNSFLEGNRIFEEDKKELFMQLLDNNYHTQAYRYTAIGVPWAKLYRADFLRINNLSFDIALKRNQDNIFNFKVFSQAKQVRYIDFAGYHYTVEHVERYPYTYDAETHVYLSEFLRMQIELIKKLELYEDAEAYGLLIKEAVKIYIMIVQKNYYANPDMNYLEKCGHAKKLLKEEPFLELFKKAKNVKSVKLVKCAVHLNLIVLVIIAKNTWKRLHWHVRANK